MLEQVKQIVEGWKNVLIKDEDIEKMAEEREKICNICIYQSENAKALSNYKTIRPDVHCTKCGCPLEGKVRSPKTECPEKKWLAHDSSKES
jgi:hypothetical protein